MATNLEIDGELITRAVRLGHHRTKKAAVTKALTDYIHHIEQESILSLFGSLEYERQYNYKRQRSKA
jgi:Arc/MetJ family transcription regulator